MADRIDTIKEAFAEVTKKSNQVCHISESKLNEFYRIVTELTNDCLWEWDIPKKMILWIDGGHKRILGYKIENEAVSQNFWEGLVHPDDRIRVIKKLHDTISEGTATCWEDEYRFKKADGDYAFVRDRGQIIYEGAKACRMIGITQDITAATVAQKLLKESESKLVDEKITRQKLITNAILEAQEKERESIGKELHDNLNQVLGAAKLYIEYAKTNEEHRLMCLDKASGYLIGVIGQIRKIAKGLVPQIMTLGLNASIKSLLKDILRVTPIKINYHSHNLDESLLDENLKMAIYRILQEQLNNILKHSNATVATINMSRPADDIILIISDNGKGYNSADGKSGMGLSNIISRAEMFTGSVVINSKPGAGFELRVLLPLNIHT